MGKYYLVGDCSERGGLQYGSFREEVAEDATELAQLISNSRTVSKSFFRERAVVSVRVRGSLDTPGLWEFGYNGDRDILWAYNTRNDKHYFYAAIRGS